MMVLAVIAVMMMQNPPKLDKCKQYCKVGTITFEVDPTECERIHMGGQT